MTKPHLIDGDWVTYLVREVVGINMQTGEVQYAPPRERDPLDFLPHYCDDPLCSELTEPPEDDDDL